MKTNEKNPSSDPQSSANKSFFGSSSDRPFFSAQRATTTPFFQPKSDSTASIQSKSDSDAAEGISQTESLVSSTHHFSAFPIQAKMTVGAADDQYEQEADRVAAAVVQQIHAPVAATGERQAVQRKGKDEEALKMSPLAERIQRRGKDEEELKLKPSLQRVGAEGGDVSDEMEGEIQRARGGGQSLAPELQHKMGQAMGADFSGVRVHTDGRADGLNRAVGARAFTTGQNLFFKRGEYQLGSREGQELIAHELTHVMQQRRSEERTRQIEQNVKGGQKAGKIQREPLTKSRLNVVGETHEESDKRRKAEMQFSYEKTGSKNYWRESLFPAINRRSGIKGDMRTVDTKLLSEEKLAAPGIDFYKRSGDPLRHRIYAILLLLKHDYTALILDEIPGQVAGFGSEEAQKDWRSAHANKELEKFILTVVNDTRNLKKEKAGGASTEIRAVDIELLSGAVEALYKQWVHISSWLRKPQKEKDLILKSATLKALFNMAEGSAERLSGIKGKKETLEEIKELWDETVYVRSEEMHKAANENAGIRGVWKVGDRHAEDMSISESLVKGSKGRKYNLVREREFITALGTWEKESKGQAEAPAVIEAPGGMGAAADTKEDELKMKPSLQRGGAEGGEVSEEFEGELSRTRGGGQPLSTELQAKMGEAMGADFSGVRVHTDGRADWLNRAVGARAFTTGQDLFFKRGEYQPGSRGGQDLIAHELTHVVQQGKSTLTKLNNTHEKKRIFQKENYHSEFPLQRYVDGEEFKLPGARISDGYSIVLENERELYAKKHKIEEGNVGFGEKANVKLHPGAEKKFEFIEEALLRVIPKYKEKQIRHVDPILKATADFSPREEDTTKKKGIRSDGYSKFVTEQMKQIENLEGITLKFIIDRLLSEPDSKDRHVSISAKQFLDFRTEVLEPWMIKNQVAAKYLDEARLYLTADKGDALPSINDFSDFIYTMKKMREKTLSTELNRAHENELILPTDCFTAALALGATHTKRKSSPDIGETHFVDLEGETGWQNHWATVIMTDEQDTVTLENAAGIEKAPLDRTTWYFGMYGTREKGKSFEEEYREKSAARSKGIAQTISDIKNRRRAMKEDAMQMKPLVQMVGAEGGEVSAEFESELNAARGSGQSLAPELQAQIGEAMGVDLSGVRVHTDGRADALNRAVGARAFTTKQDLFFKRGEYQPGSRGGQELIAHELTHVVQQNSDNILNRYIDINKLKKIDNSMEDFDELRNDVKKYNRSARDLIEYRVLVNPQLVDSLEKQLDSITERIKTYEQWEMIEFPTERLDREKSSMRHRVDLWRAQITESEKLFNMLDKHAGVDEKQNPLYDMRKSPIGKIFQDLSGIGLHRTSMPDIRLKPPADKYVYHFTDEYGRVWTRDYIETDKWYRPGENGEKVWWTKEDDQREDDYNAAGREIVSLFEHPEVLWGMSHKALAEELRYKGFYEVAYKGTSNAHAFEKYITRDESIISIVINYGGGIHDAKKVDGENIYSPAYYYKIEWNKRHLSTKLVHPEYPKAEIGKEPGTRFFVAS